ncbi:MAG TPA: diguanylate cyclase [Burkholderiales bacterium]|nr:diguanylate cyclase [Burkholderiales bacterium]
MNAVNERRLEEGLRFARRIYLPRTVGLGAGFVCIAGGLWQQDAAALAYVLLALNTLAWPHLAWPLARRSRNPYRAELRNLVVDSMSGGLWAGYLGFNLVPAAVLVGVLAMDKAVIGGPRFLARCFAAQALAALAGFALAGFELRLASATPTVLASLPLLLIYPIAVGFNAHSLARRVRQQNLLLETLSSTDGLTGLLNRMYWEQAMAAEFARCRRHGQPSAVMMIDIDHFKAINDRHGHATGDEVIRCVAEMLRSATRGHDLVGRYGGEEFGVLLPGTDLEGAVVLAERVRRSVESEALDSHTGVRGTVSIGVAQLDPDDASHEAWISRADRALYEAKGAGRNRVERA